MDDECSDKNEPDEAPAKRQKTADSTSGHNREAHMQKIFLLKMRKDQTSTHNWQDWYTNFFVMRREMNEKKVKFGFIKRGDKG